MLRSFLGGIASVLVFGCTVPVTEGGNNGNDRTNGGEQGETLLTGAMTVSPNGKWALMQRNQTSVLFDVEGLSAREMPTQVSRLVFGKTADEAVAVLPDRTVVAYDLRTVAELWRRSLPFTDASAPSLLRWTDDDQNLVLGDGASVFVLDAADGVVRGQVGLRSAAAELSFVPETQHALIAGVTRWSSHLPATEVADLDLVTLKVSSIDVPNCSAPIAVLPDASRALLSPTFCEEGQASTGEQTWTNPDPVSVIDRDGEGLHFLKNLPGFGPVALDPTGTRAVAYLDLERVDPSMFEDPSQIPSSTGPRYHVMSIDPQSLSFALFPIGDVLPRFVLAKDGATLLVDATVRQVRGHAKLTASIDSSGHVTARFSVFGAVDSLFGALDLASGQYVPFSGATAALDRFVQMSDANRVFTLKLSADGTGGDLYRIDLDTRSATSLNWNLRDIGLLGDGQTLLLRERLPAISVQVSGRFDWYRRERYCLSLDGIKCSGSVEFRDSTPFQSGPTCTSYHDC